MQLDQPTRAALILGVGLETSLGITNITFTMGIYPTEAEAQTVPTFWLMKFVSMLQL